jgi:NAD(P)H-dependent flavin oxidoreductase YrpB (nitropropane dioxygenase family)
MLSFADPAPYAKRVKQARVPLICQVHTVDQARRATDVGGDIVAPQGKRLDHPRAGFVGNDLVACFQG